MPFKNNYQLIVPRCRLRQLLVFFVTSFSVMAGFAQVCPSNIDFEKGDFSNWTCYTGYTSAVGTENVISLAPSGPVPEKHTMYNIASNSGELDPLGKFPVLCPNGSGHSVRLGSQEAGGEAEGISYEFTIPANAHSYSLIYHYAVVFQSPNHRVNEQPRMEIEVMNVTDNVLISCSSFSFIAVGSSMPGFKLSSVTDTISVLYKEWSAVSVDLSGNAGKTIRLFFKTADCTFRRHFGYGYVDVNSECTSNISGAEYCPDDTLVSLTAPFGYQKYTWYNESFSSVLGTAQSLVFSPPPPAGTTFAVKVEPYDGYGCPSTLFTKLKDSLTLVPDAGRDVLSCNKDPVLLGSNPKTGWRYQWSPASGLSNANIANPFARPVVTTNYVLQVSNTGGGCKAFDTVVVKASTIDSTLELIGKEAFCIDNGDSAVLKVQPTEEITWVGDNGIIRGSNGPLYKVTNSGSYYARLRNIDGCTAITGKKLISIDRAKKGISYPVAYAVINLPLTLHARPIGVDVFWDPASNLNNALKFDPVFTGALETLYTITIKSAAGCIAVDTQLVKIVKNVEVYVPNAFTPNGDGRNDVLRPHLRGIINLRYFKIFNRWGELVFERTDEQGWDGSFKGKPQSSQTVVWMLEGLGADGVIYTKKGTSTLIR